MCAAERLSRSHELAAWIEHEVDGLPGPALLKNQLARTCFIVAQEHHQATLLLLSQHHPIYASAFALVRPVYESFVRGVWLLHGASEEELQAFLEGKPPPNMRAMLKAVENAPDYGSAHLSKIYTNSWNAMCAYTHTGAQQIQRWNNGNFITSNFSDEEVDEVLRFTGTLALRSVVGLAKVADNNALVLRALHQYEAWSS